MIQEYEWRNAKKATWQGTFRKPEPFAAIDPGGDGAVLLWDEPGGLPALVMTLPGHASDLQAAVEIARRQISLVVIEAQYHHKNAITALKLARRAGILLGHISHACPYDVRVVFIPPASWQSILGKDRRGKTKALAQERAAADFGSDSRYTMASKAIQSGIADAYGLARWWCQQVNWVRVWSTTVGGSSP